MMPARQMAPPRAWASVNKTYSCEQATAAWCEQVPVPTPARWNSHPPARATVSRRSPGSTRRQAPTAGGGRPRAGTCGPPPQGCAGPDNRPHPARPRPATADGRRAPAPAMPRGAPAPAMPRGLQLRRRHRWWGRDGQIRRQRDDLVDERHQQQHQAKEEPEQASVLHFGIPRPGAATRWRAGASCGGGRAAGLHQLVNAGLVRAAAGRPRPGPGGGGPPGPGSPGSIRRYSHVPGAAGSDGYVTASCVS
jgi:hypothetical protein